LKVNSFLC